LLETTWQAADFSQASQPCSRSIILALQKEYSSFLSSIEQPASVNRTTWRDLTNDTICMSTLILVAEASIKQQGASHKTSVSWDDQEAQYAWQKIPASSGLVC
jgi:hypothetical protein